ncbi:putative holin-like toxin [Staphylococcus condimenti]
MTTFEVIIVMIVFGEFTLSLITIIIEIVKKR